MELQRRRAYPTDLNEKQWSRIAVQFPQLPRPRGRPRTWAYREILNAIFYIVRSGEAWRLLPPLHPPRLAAAGDFMRRRRDGVVGNRQHSTALSGRLRLRRGAPPQPGLNPRHHRAQDA